MRPVELSQAFLALATPRDLAEIVRRLLQLEAERLNMPVGSTGASLRINVADEGEDGVSLHVPEGRETRLPAGDTLFQFKTTREMGAILADVTKEASKARPQAILAAGGSYILVYAKDLVGQERDSILQKLKESIPEEHRERVEVWGAGMVEELCWDNPAIAYELSLAPVHGVLPFSHWSAGVLGDAPRFAPDSERARAIAEIRERIRTSTDTHLFHLVGDAGVGKTRLVREALDVEQVRDQVLTGVAGGAVEELLNYLASRPNAHCLLVVDDVDPGNVDALARAAQLASGRVRLITISLPGDRRWVRPSPWDIVLGPLEKTVIEGLLKDDLGLPEGDARRIAEVSEGYPRLAIEVARAYQQDQTLGDLTSAVESRTVNQLLERMIPDGQSRGFLQVAAMFKTIGVEGDPRGELDAIAAAFDLDPVLMADALRLVWTIEQLLWPKQTTEIALDLLLRLAENESESFANNATGVLTDSFQMHLGGTTTPYDRRLGWLMGKLDEGVPTGRIPLLVRALCAGLRSHQVRTHGERHGSIGIRDWRPTSVDEELQLRRAIWSALFHALELAPAAERESVSTLIAGSVRQAATRGLLREVLASLDRADWTPGERAELANALRAIVSYDKPEEPYMAEILSRLEALLGGEFRDRAQTVFNTRVWELLEDRTLPSQTPPVIESLVSAASTDPMLLLEAMSVAQTVHEQNTAYIFFRRWGLRNDPRRLATTALAQKPIFARCLPGSTLRCRGERGWRVGRSAAQTGSQGPRTPEEPSAAHPGDLAHRHASPNRPGRSPSRCLASRSV